MTSLGSVGLLLDVSDNPTLSFCASTGVCAFLDNGGPANFENNLPGCNSTAQVQTACGGGLGLVISNNSRESKASRAGDRAGIEQSTDAAALSVFPNPTPGLFTVSIADERGGQIRLIDLSGQILAQQQTGQNTVFDLSAHPAGVYWLDIRFDDKTNRRHKVIKQ